ncbi:MAG: bifunctional diaminohydroxyphosphoribosylaminopyrimidine deaminase/5-amino-6-(5-phosphoribosylamino)uracil reductase RibD [Alphaproteobacteria bacterium]
MDFDRKYIQISLYLLKKIIGTTFPNPPVVSLIVEFDKNLKEDKIVSFGITGFGGRPHAEATALKNMKYRKNKIYTLYSTLEPCCHEGRDESCVLKILKGKIQRVVYSLRDPDFRVDGGGAKLLTKNGVEVLGNLMDAESKKIYSGYIMNRKLKRPKVIIKMACSLDGKIALKKNKRTRITNQSVKKIVHIIRSEVDAILVGSNTVIVDNPLLNCRIKGFESFSPYRIVLSQKLSFDINSHIFKNCLKYPTIVFTIDSNKRKIEELSSKKVKIIILEKKEFNLKNIMYKLAKLGICNLLVEGGSKIFTSFLNENLYDEVMIFRSSGFIGSTGQSAISNLNLSRVKKKLTLKQIYQIEDNSLEVLEVKRD